uniref:Phosphorylase b kinase regulatory subunit n=1 Tax=Macrostomum lignano TaxID=282301 RepID=A0A1I8F6H9_9PLAT
CWQQFYQRCSGQILPYQHPITGLFPLYPESDPPCYAGHVRDNIYIATSIWALAQGVPQKPIRTAVRCWELRQRALKCMRSILNFWMTQTDRLEAFKEQQKSKAMLADCVRLSTGGELIDSAFKGYQHHQLDSVVNVFQNLIFYLERAYRIPDFGMWERGTKQNTGSVELHASSVGLRQGPPWKRPTSGDHTTVIHVDIDAHSRNRIILTNLLPRESATKGCDSSLIPTLCWPGHATHESVRKSALQNVFDRVPWRLRLQNGSSRDGYGCAMETSGTGPHRRTFEHVECQWPIFYAFLVIEHCLQGDTKTATVYKRKLDSLLVELDSDGAVPPPWDPSSRQQQQQPRRWMPKFYFVPRDYLQDEYSNPGSQTRRPNFQLGDPIFLWGEAVMLIADLMESGYLMAHDLDLLRRHKPFHERPLDLSRRVPFINKLQDLVVQGVLISESVRLQQMLATFGVEPITLWPSKNLIRVQECLGRCDRLSLSGRPLPGHGQVLQGPRARTVLCYPLLFEMRDFYLLHDMDMVIDEVRTNLLFLSTWWRLKGRPTFCFLLREDMIRGSGAKQLIAFLTSMRSGWSTTFESCSAEAQNLLASACDHNHAFRDLPSVEELSVEKSFRSLMNIQGHAAGGH